MSCIKFFKVLVKYLWVLTFKYLPHMRKKYLGMVNAARYLQLGPNLGSQSLSVAGKAKNKINTSF